MERSETQKIVNVCERGSYTVVGGMNFQQSLSIFVSEMLWLSTRTHSVLVLARTKRYIRPAGTYGWCDCCACNNQRRSGLRPGSTKKTT